MDAERAFVAEAARRATTGAGGRGATRVQLHAHAQRLLRCVRCTRHCVARARSRRCGCVSGACRLSRVAQLATPDELGVRRAAEHLSVGQGRARRDDRAARHGRRPGAAVPARSGYRWDRHRRRRRRRACCAATRRAGTAGASRHGDRPACSWAQAVRTRSPALRRARRCCRFALRAGSATQPRTGPCTAAPTRCSRGSSAQWIRTATATRTTPHVLRSSGSRSRSRALPTVPVHLQPRVRPVWTPSSSRPPATTARPARATAASPGPGALPPC